MAGRRRVRGAKSAKYYYTPGQEFREAITGDEYIGPYFKFQGKFGTGVDAEDSEAKLLLPYTTAPEVIQYRGKYEDFNDFFRYPKSFRPTIKPKMKVVNRVFAYDSYEDKFFEISPRVKKYYDKDKPLRKRFLVSNILWTLKGVDAIDKNIDKISESPFPGEVKDLYLDPTEYINESGAITTIDGIPLFATVEQALAYGATAGLEGYHTHMYRGRLGFMAGASHGLATGEYSGTGSPGTDVSYSDSDSETYTPPGGSGGGGTSTSGGGGTGGSGGGGTGGGGSGGGGGGY